MRALLLTLVALTIPRPAPPADLDALFAGGVAWEQFLQTVQAQRQTWVANTERAAVAPALVERLKAVAPGLTILVIAEPNCSDSVQSVPYIAKLAAESGVQLRIVNKATGAPAIDAHRTPDGRTATPTIVLIRGGKDAGAWIERPVALQTWYLSKGDLGQEEKLARKKAWYEWDRGESTLAEIVALAEKQ